MPTGAITEYIDVAQVTLYAFWVFFFALIFYLHRENKREGYPLESERSAHITVQGFPAIPEPKQYRLPHGGIADTAGGRPDRRPVAARPSAPFPGAPLEPTGDPMLDGVGPAAWAERADTPDLTLDGDVKIVPLRGATDFSVAMQDPDPRGMPVVAADGEVAGTVRDIWFDRFEPMVRYLEVEVSVPSASEHGAGAHGTGEEADSGEHGTDEAAPGPSSAAATRNVLVPIMLTKIRRARRAPPGGPLGERLPDGRPREVQVVSVRAEHFARAPVTRNPDQVTLLEEERISAYFGSGHLYALPSRREPLI